MCNPKSYILFRCLLYTCCTCTPCTARDSPFQNTAIFVACLLACKPTTAHMLTRMRQGELHMPSTTMMAITGVKNTYFCFTKAAKLFIDSLDHAVTKVLNHMLLSPKIPKAFHWTTKGRNLWLVHK